MKTGGLRSGRLSGTGETTGECSGEGGVTMGEVTMFKPVEEGPARGRSGADSVGRDSVMLRIEDSPEVFKEVLAMIELIAELSVCK
jgi:hypothetical protein